MFSLYSPLRGSGGSSSGGLSRRSSLPVIQADLENIKELGFYLDGGKQQQQLQMIKI